MRDVGLAALSRFSAVMSRGLIEALALSGSSLAMAPRFSAVMSRGLIEASWPRSWSAPGGSVLRGDEPRPH